MRLGPRGNWHANVLLMHTIQKLAPKLDPFQLDLMILIHVFSLLIATL